MERKAQASTEYLIILAVVIAVALVVVSLLSPMLNKGAEINKKNAQIYWKSSDIGILDWVISSDGADALRIINNQQYDIYIHNISLDDVTQSVNTTLRVGEGKTFNSYNWDDCEKGEAYGFTVSFAYDNKEFNLTGKTFTGAEKLVGNCE